MTVTYSKYLTAIFFLLLIKTPINKGLSAYSFFQSDSLISGIDSITVKDLSDSSSVNIDSQAVKDTLIPIYPKGFLSEGNHGHVLTKETIQKNDYRYTGDLFKYTPAGFVYDLGWLGQPNEISLYGKGFQNISYIVDGINFNNRNTNSLDLYTLQSESIDSLEILPLPKGFLYGSNNNLVTVSFYTKDTVSSIPQSRIRFFQAPDDETYIDASFSALVMSKLNFSFDVTNSSISSRFDNSNYGGWKASAKLRYMPSNNFNIIAGYHYVKTETELNGGSSALNKNDVNYDNLLETVVYPTESVSGRVFSSRYQKYNQHNVYLKLLGSFFNDLQSEITLYRLFSNTEFRQNERTNLPGIPTIINDNKFTTTGLSFKQDIDVAPLELQVLANYESIEFNTGILNSAKTLNNFSVGGTASLKLFDDKIEPSFFTKYLNYDGSSFYGMGADINFRIIPEINLYGGYSRFEKQQDLLFVNSNEPVNQKINTFELGFKYESKYVSGSTSFFNTKNNNEVFYTFDRTADTVVTNEASGFFTKTTEVNGINLDINLRLWKFLITANTSYYLNHDKEKLTLPEFTFFGGAYYLDTLFNSNLKLKAGFNFYANGSQYYHNYDFQRNIRVQYADYGNEVALLSNEFSDINYQLDLFVAGQFQDSAILYITFENVIGLNYYIVPYFPKQPRALRFGISWEFLN